jgi:hypothetical protein
MSDNSPRLSRRALLALAGGASLTLISGAADAQGVGIGAIHVDNRRLLALGGGQPAAEMKLLLEAELRRLYAGQMRRGGAALVVTLRSLNLNSHGGQNGGRHGGGGSSSNDTMETDAMLVGPRNELIAQTSVLSPVGAGIGMRWTPEIQTQRLRDLAAHNAGWIRRYLPA